LITFNTREIKQSIKKHVQKLIFISVGVYVGSMTYFQILDPHKVREFISINEPFLKKLVKEEPRESKRGRKRIGERWVILAIAIIARIEGIAWRKVEEKLSLCDFLIEEGWMRNIPSKSTFHAVWRATESKILEQWIIELGEEIVRKKGLKALSVDSSGFKIRQASVWRFLKWSRGTLKKTSNLNFSGRYIL